jgi:predicted DNA-binding protein
MLKRMKRYKMSRVLSLSLTDNLYDRVSKHAGSQGLTVYKYVRQAIETMVLNDDHIIEMLPQHDDE